MSGIATDYGGVLCPIAAMAREHCIPCVVNVEGVTTSLPPPSSATTTMMMTRRNSLGCGIIQGGSSKSKSKIAKLEQNDWIKIDGYVGTIEPMY